MTPVSTTEGAPSAWGRALALAALSLLAALAVSWDEALSLRAALAASMVVVAAASYAAPPAARSITALLAVLGVVMVSGLLWQLAMAAAIAGHLALTRLLPALAPSSEWRARGELPAPGIALVAGVTPIALVGWVLLVHPDLGDVVEAYGLRAYPLALLIAGAVAFATFNALLEEMVWRGMLQDRLTALFGAGVAIVLQGASFGLQHWHGIPRGPIGALLAGTWGVMLGVLRHRARGLLAPFLAHVVADTVIAIIVFTLYR